LHPFYDAKEAYRDYTSKRMFSVPHLVIIFIVVLVVFGPHKLPELARSLGKMMAEFRKASTDFRMAFEEEMRTIERQARETEWKKSQEVAGAEETPPILPETATPAEPAIVPVSESVARESQTTEPAANAYATPITEGTPPAVNDATAPGPAEPDNLPAHDPRQPA